MTKLSNKFKFSLATLLLLLTLPHTSQAAACCGGALALPSLITGDEGAKLTGSWSASQLQTDVFASGVWRKRTETESGQVFRLEGAQVFAERWQYGAGIPLQQRSRSENSSSGIGDLTAHLGYQILPELEEHPEYPRALSFLSLTAPTGTSIYDSADPQALDSRGRGFWSIGTGVVLTKAWIQWDANAALSARRSFERRFENSQVQGTAKPGWGGDLSWGAGYHLGRHRLGAGIAWSFDEAVRVEGASSSSGSESRFATANLSWSYLVSSQWSSLVSYSDQSWFGDPLNTTLSRSVNFSLQRRWAD